MMKDSFDFNLLEQMTETLRAVAHPLRLAIIEMLYRNKQMSVTDIHEMLGSEQAIVSHHLRIMKDRNLVQVKRDGKSAIYSLTNPAYFEVYEKMRKVCEK
jgi:DNA-binding transcriptional ArsR family regulator